MKESKGIVDYVVKANFPKKHFRILPICKDKDSLRRFVTTEPHATAVKKFKIWAGESLPS